MGFFNKSNRIPKHAFHRTSASEKDSDRNELLIDRSTKKTLDIESEIYKKYIHAEHDYRRKIKVRCDMQLDVQVKNVHHL